MAYIVPQAPNILSQFQAATEGFQRLQQLAQSVQQQRQLAALRQQLQAGGDNVPSALAQLATYDPGASQQAREGFLFPSMQQESQAKAIRNLANAARIQEEINRPLEDIARNYYDFGYRGQDLQKKGEAHQERLTRIKELAAKSQGTRVNVYTEKPTAAVAGKLQEGIIGSLGILNGIDLIEKMEGTEKFLGYKGKSLNWAADKLDRAGLGDLIPGVKERVSEFSKFKFLTDNIRQQIRVEVTGLAAPEAELKRIENFVRAYVLIGQYANILYNDV